MEPPDFSYLTPDDHNPRDTPISLAVQGLIALGLEELVPIFLILVGLMGAASILYPIGKLVVGIMCKLVAVLKSRKE
jgi:hypothetical protein